MASCLEQLVLVTPRLRLGVGVGVVALDAFGAGLAGSQLSDREGRRVAGLDRVTGVSRGRLRGDGQAVRFVAVVVNGVEVVVLGRRATSQHLRRVRGSTGSGRDPDPGLARGPRDHAGWAARWAGAGPGAAARRRRGAARHVAGRGSAPASALTDQHPGSGRKTGGWGCTRSECGTPWTRSTASDKPQSRRTRTSVQRSPGTGTR